MHYRLLSILPLRYCFPCIYLQDGLITLVPRVVDLVGDREIPVIAAGGIVDARGYVAALALGAQGVCLGTRF